MANITRAHASKAYHALGRAHRKIASMSARTEKVVESFTRTIEISAGALVGGVVEGKGGEEGINVFGIDATLLAGLGLAGASYFGAAGKRSEDVGNFADGLLAAYVSKLGFVFGKNWRTTGKFSLSDFGTKLSGESILAGEKKISPKEMASIMARVQPQTHAAGSPVAMVPVAANAE